MFSISGYVSGGNFPNNTIEELIDDLSIRKPIDFNERFSKPFQSGKVVLINGDTLSGSIVNINPISLSTSCHFKPEGLDTIYKYSAYEIKEFWWIEGKRYISKELESGDRVFLEYLIKGKLNIYYHRKSFNQSYFLVEKEEIDLLELPYKEEYIINKAGKRVLSQSKNHMGILRFITQDAEGFEKEWSKIKKPTHENLIDFAKTYHYKVCDTEDCIIYEKRMPKVAFATEFYYSRSLLSNKELPYNTSDNVGFYFYIIPINLSKILQFRTGFQISEFGKDDISLKYSVVPIHAQFQLTKSKIQPVFYVGVNNYYFRDYTKINKTAAGFGVDFAIFKKVIFTSGFNAELKHGTLGGKTVISNSHAEIFKPTTYGWKCGLKLKF